MKALNNENKIQNLGFKTPDSYFEDFERSMEQKIQEYATPVLPIYEQKWFYTLVSSAAILLFICTLFYQSQSNSAHNDYTYLDEYFEEIEVQNETLSLMDFYISEDDDFIEYYVFEQMIDDDFENKN